LYCRPPHAKIFASPIDIGKHAYQDHGGHQPRAQDRDVLVRTNKAGGVLEERPLFQTSDANMHRIAADIYRRAHGVAGTNGDVAEVYAVLSKFFW
jgi:hypothetical protein